jgi:hypothetical protein
MAPLSRGTRYYRAHAEQERLRKKIERDRIASSARAFVERHPDYANRWRLTLREIESTREGTSFVRHRWAMDRASERDFRAFLREHGWATPQREAPLGRPQFTVLDRQRKGFVIGALGESPEVYEVRYGGR